MPTTRILTFIIPAGYLERRKIRITDLIGTPFEYEPGVAERARIHVGKDLDFHVIGETISVHPGNRTATVKIYPNHLPWVERVILKIEKPESPEAVPK